MRVEEFTYPLPDSAIAQEPVEPRHEARLLDTRDLSDHRFFDLPELLDPGDLVVVNDSRVRSARLIGVKTGGGGNVELLMLDPLPNGTWHALARPSRRLRPGVRIEFPGLSATIVDGPEQGLVVVELEAEDVEGAIESAGEVPLPPYFKGQLSDPERYQTMFARLPGSAAAPTAGLHFTDEVVAGLGRREIEIASVDLHVGIDTFRPMTVELIEDHQMHTEWCSVPEATAAAVNGTRERGGAVVAIGTTVVRALESNAGVAGILTPGKGETNLYLRPGSSFRVVDKLVTNFHVPGSTLMVLVAAFMGEQWREAYRHALDNGYRFLSFGDAMLARRHDR
ncbi:MAG: tRNA preQ1(34) S-adenosylmethionine ribosyltransferase-isomerase QueA [Actinomycetota bacterium]|nr:tRNA preQ1(34) S-adenosylmethionine ribosyltransferase-isomerase QueA [Actinomycetota bacterium]